MANLIALMNGFASLMSPKLIAFMIGGVIIGIIFGAVPGLSATMAIVLFLPVTFNMIKTEAFTLLVALYVGGVSGGLISAILINIPGSAMSIATCYDGAPMAKAGHAKRALGIGIVYSFFGTVLSLAILVFAAPSLASVAVKLSSYEFFSLTIMTLCLVASTSKDIFKALASCLIGLGMCQVGLAPIDGAARLTFGSVELLQGIPMTGAAIGMFAVTEILLHVATPIKPENREMRHVEKIKGFGFSPAEMFAQTKNFFIAFFIGLGIGFLPGMGGSLANQVAYLTVQKTSKYPEKFGTGIMDGIVASETSNNASIGGAMIPLMALGIPGDGPTMMLLSAFTIHGLTAGPLLFKQEGDLVNLIFAAMFICTFLMLIIEFFGIPVFAKIIEVPKEILYPVILVTCTVSCYANKQSMGDCWGLLAFGIIGFLMSKFKMNRTCFILGFILGTNIETYLRRALQRSRGSFLPFVTKPISAVLLLIALFLITRAIIAEIVAAKKAKKAQA